jgi:antitoxin component YwqK of YwqJK toxin-antitoxin module
MNGWWRLFDQSGQLVHEGQFLNGVPAGHQRLYVDGMLHEEGHMERGRRNGTWARYGADGGTVALDEW